MADIEHPEIANDKSSLVNYHLNLGLRNMSLTPEQRDAFHTAIINAARVLRMQLLFALPDQKLAAIKLERQSGTMGRRPVPFFEE